MTDFSCQQLFDALLDDVTGLEGSKAEKLDWLNCCDFELAKATRVLNKTGLLGQVVSTSFNLVDKSGLASASVSLGFQELSLAVTSVHIWCLSESSSMSLLSWHKFDWPTWTNLLKACYKTKYVSKYAHICIMISSNNTWRQDYETQH